MFSNLLQLQLYSYADELFIFDLGLFVKEGQFHVEH